MENTPQNNSLDFTKILEPAKATIEVNEQDLVSAIENLKRELVGAEKVGNVALASQINGKLKANENLLAEMGAKKAINKAAANDPFARDNPDIAKIERKVA